MFLNLALVQFLSLAQANPICRDEDAVTKLELGSVVQLKESLEITSEYRRGYRTIVRMLDGRPYENLYNMVDVVAHRTSMNIDENSILKNKVSREVSVPAGSCKITAITFKNHSLVISFLNEQLYSPKGCSINSITIHNSLKEFFDEKSNSTIGELKYQLGEKFSFKFACH